MTPLHEAVVDASVALKWVLDAPASPWARAFPADAVMVAPALLWSLAPFRRWTPAVLSRS